MKFLFSFILTISISNVFSQTNDSIEIIHGSEKYRKEIIEISKEYSKRLDSVQKERFEKMSENNLYSGHDGGLTGYLMEEYDKKIETIINRFLKIDRVSSSSIMRNETGTEYGFKYYRTIKNRDNTTKTIHGQVTWVNN